ncbi:MAG: hydrolase [bacterium]|nr:MAG: hydrolase [bacterium]
MQNLDILYLQSDLAWENPAQNRENFEKKILAQGQGCDLIVLPETFTTGFPVDPAPFAETTDGESLQWMQRLAAETGAVISGSLLLKEETTYSNALIWMRPDGTFERYNKRHVFSMGGEHKHIKAGNRQLQVELKGWKIKPMVCYDLRFPVWSKNRYENGAFEYDLVIYVANWPAVRAYPWDALLVARAIENQAFVLGVNRVGTDGQGNAYPGHSKLVDARGMILSEAPENEEVSMRVNLSGKQLQDFRNKFNVGCDWDRFEITIL